ncbi:MAG: HAMP domain-containing histidine kinase, partial [Sedimentisphaerales bacterium]|nr:HAMP domain-containing histidine kinase [Sedimentisphaerales bacterium]
MRNISTILQKNSLSKGTSSNNVIAKNSCPKYKEKKSFQDRPYHIPEASQELHFRRRNNSERASERKLRKALKSNLTTDEFNRFINHMTRTEWLASLGTLSATMAHELLQRLTIIHLSLDDILDRLQAATLPLESTVRDLKDVLVQLSHFTSMVQRFRNLTRKCPERAINPIDIKLIAERIVTVLNKSAAQKKIKLQIKNLEKLPTVHMNEREIEQLFFILIENAIQAADGR